MSAPQPQPPAWASSYLLDGTAPSAAEFPHLQQRYPFIDCAAPGVAEMLRDVPTDADCARLDVSFARKDALSRLPIHTGFRVYSTLVYRARPTASTSTDSPDIKTSVSASAGECTGDAETFESFVHGTNTEASFFAQSICAERSALMSLRARDDFIALSAVYVVSDAPVPLSPGLLCREFLSEFLSPYAPIVIASRLPCTNDSNKSSTDAKSDNSIVPSVTFDATTGLSLVVRPCGARYHARVLRLHWLYPHPSPYQSLWRDAAALAEAKKALAAAAARALESPAALSAALPASISSLIALANDNSNSDTGTGIGAGTGATDTTAMAHALATAVAAAPRAAALARAAAAARDPDGGIARVSLGACAVLADGSYVTANQVKVLEMGHSLDPGLAVYAAVNAHQHKHSGNNSGDAVVVVPSAVVVPVLVVISDADGVLHPPSSPARALWSEQGWATVPLLLQSLRCPTQPAAARARAGERADAGVYADITSPAPLLLSSCSNNPTAAAATDGDAVAVWLPRRRAAEAVMTLTRAGALNPCVANFLEATDDTTGSDSNKNMSCETCSCE